MGKSKKRRRSSTSSSSDSYEWKAAKIPITVTQIYINCLQESLSEPQGDDEFSGIINRISSSKFGVKGVFALPQEKIAAGSQIGSAYFPKKVLSTSAKDQGTGHTQMHSKHPINDGEEHSSLFLEDKPTGASAGCAEVVEERYVTISDINTMAARLLKAELSGNKEKVDKIKSKLERLREAQRRNQSCSPATVDRDGRSPPLYIKESKGSSFSENYERSRCHGGRSGRNGYLFDGGDSCTIKEMIRQEKLEMKSSCDRQFASLSGRCKDGVDDEYGDTFVNENVKLQGGSRSRLRSDAITDYKRREYAESTCSSCMDHTPRYLVMSVRQSMFLSLPEHASLSRGHCFLTPLEHVGAMTRVDEAAVEEARAFKRDLCRMAALWKGKGASYVFMEVAGYSNSFKHHVQIECVPVGREAMDELPSYFKKAMLDLGSEWDQNKRILSLERSGTGVYKAIPPNFGYFCVEFGIDGGGYAKVIEDWSAFPLHFGREVLAGVLGKSVDKWRKPKKDPLEQLRRKAVEFEEKWMTVEKSTNEHGSTIQRTEIPATATSSAGYHLEPEGPELPP